MPDRTNIIQYPNLGLITDINEVFDKVGRCIVFIPLSKSFGHWCCLIKKNTSIEWFDPYSVKPDDEKKWINKKVLKRLHEDKPLLTRLLEQENRENGTKILYNPYKWQKDTEGTNDCGRYVALRCLMYNKSLSEMDNMIKSSGMTPDEFVTNVTFELLGK